MLLPIRYPCETYGQRKTGSSGVVFFKFHINRNRILLAESVLCFHPPIHSFFFRVVLSNLDLSLLQGVLLVMLSLMGSCQEMFFLSGSEWELSL